MTGDNPLWTVESTRDDTILDPQHGVMPAVRVTFSTASGQRSYIVVERESFTVDRVKQLVHDAAVEIERVMSMTGPPQSVPLQSAEQLAGTMIGNEPF